MKKLTTPTVATAQTTTLLVSSDIAYPDILSTSQIEKLNEIIRLRVGPITATGTALISNALPAGYVVKNIILDVTGTAAAGTALSMGTTTASTTTIINGYATTSIAATGYTDITTSIVTLNPTNANRNISIAVTDTASGTPNMYINVTLSKVVTL